MPNRLLHLDETDPLVTRDPESRTINEFLMDGNVVPSYDQNIGVDLYNQALKI
jgi:hypothetical protein